MAHRHPVYDTDPHFIIDPDSRQITYADKKPVVLIQNDHKSEHFTFELPKKIDGHDMTLCDLVQVHYLNIGSNTRNSGLYEITDLQVVDGSDTVVCSWEITQNATSLAGSLSFMLRFACTTDGVIDYVWNTAIFTGITISPGIDNSDEVVVEYADVLQQWYDALMASGTYGVNVVEAAKNEALKSIEEAAKDPLGDMVETQMKEYVPKVATRNLMTLTFANGIIVADTGVFLSITTGFGSTASRDYIELKDDERTYTFSWSSILPEQTINFYQYDADKKVLGKISKIIWATPPRSVTVTFDSGCKYIGIHSQPFNGNTPWENVVPVDFQMEVGSEVTPYIPPFIISNSVIDVGEQIDEGTKNAISQELGDSETKAISQKTSTWIHQHLLVSNLIDTNDADVATGGYYAYDSTNGYKWIADSTWNESGYIPVLPNEKFVICTVTAQSKNLSIMFYDESKNFVMQKNLIINEGEAFVVPENMNIRYIRVPFKNGFMLLKGDKVCNFYMYNYNELCRAFNDLKTTVNGLKPITPTTTINHWNGKTWYAYGTSLTSEAQGKYVPYVAEFGGMNVVNKGIPGGALVANKNIYNALMSTTDGKVNADLITIEVGANDASAPLGEVTSMDTTTFCGALNTCLKNILMNCPKAQVVLMPSTRSRHPLTGGEPYPLDYQTAGGYTALERDEAIRKVAEANGIYFIPFGSGLGLGLFRMQRTDKPYTVDNIHHTNLGGYNLAQGVWSYLKNIPLWYDTL